MNQSKKKVLQAEFDKVVRAYCKSVPDNIGKILVETMCNTEAELNKVDPDKPCNYCGKFVIKGVTIHQSCYERILNGEAVI